MKIECALPLSHQLEMLNAEIKALIGGPVGSSIRLLELCKQRDALQARIDEEAEIEAALESERGAPDEDGCEEYARRFGAV